MLGFGGSREGKETADVHILGFHLPLSPEEVKAIKNSFVYVYNQPWDLRDPARMVD